jgi:hypothetical protein
LLGIDHAGWSRRPTLPIATYSSTSWTITYRRKQNVPDELLFRVTTGHVTLFILFAGLARIEVVVADFKGIGAG